MPYCRYEARKKSYRVLKYSTRTKSLRDISAEKSIGKFTLVVNFFSKLLNSE